MPEERGEMWAFIANYEVRGSMKLTNFVQQELGSNLGRGQVVAGDEVGHFGQAVHDCEDYGVSIRHWEFHNEI